MSINGLSEHFIDHHIDNTIRYDNTLLNTNNGKKNLKSKNGTDTFVKPSFPLKSKHKHVAKAQQRKKTKDKWDINAIFQKNINNILMKQNNSDDNNDNMAGEDGDNRDGNDKITMTRMSKKMVDNIMKLIEGNLQDSIDNAFSNNLTQLNELLQNDQSEIDQIYHWKIKLLNEILNKIESRLEICSVPIDLNPNDINPEYIFEKRKYIQSLLQSSLTQTNDLNLIKTELNNKITDMENFIKSMDLNNTFLLQQKLLNNNLHPVLNKAVDNSFGLIKDTRDYLARDKARYNLYIHDDVNTYDSIHTTQSFGPPHQNAISERIEKETNPNNRTSDLEEIMTNLLPSLKEKERVEADLNNTLSKFLHSDRTETLKHLLNK